MATITKVSFTNWEDNFSHVLKDGKPELAELYISDLCFINWWKYIVAGILVNLKLLLLL